MDYFTISILKRILEFWISLVFLSILLVDYDGAGIIIFICLICLNQVGAWMAGFSFLESF